MNKTIVIVVIRGEEGPVKEIIQMETNKSVWIICALGCSVVL